MYSLLMQGKSRGWHASVGFLFFVWWVWFNERFFLHFFVEKVKNRTLTVSKPVNAESSHKQRVLIFNQMTFRHLVGGEMNNELSVMSAELTPDSRLQTSQLNLLCSETISKSPGGIC